MKLRVAFAVLLGCFSVSAQQPLASPMPGENNQGTVRFNFDWDQGQPWQRYSIEVGPDGKSHFDGTPNPAVDGDNEAFQQDFAMSAANRQKIFALAGKLNYFQGDFDSHQKKIARTGSKTLEYKSPEVQHSSTYNWSQNPDVQELTNLFQGIATTIDYGRKLAYQYRFDKLGMETRLRELEELQSDQRVEELAAIEPILRKIANDPNMMHISRESAQHLLKSINRGQLAAAPAQP